MFENNNAAPRRAGMLAAGIVLLFGAGLLFTVVLALDRTLAQTILGYGPPSRVGLAYLVAGTWVAAAVVGAATYLVVVANPGMCARPMRPVGPFTTFSIGVALLAPITVHLIVMVLTGSTASAFQEWARTALPLTAIAHVAFAALVGKRAARLASGRTDAPSVRQVYFTTVIVSAIPFGLLLMIPPAVVALTGIPLLPLLYGMEQYANADRGAVMLPVAQLA